MEYIESECFGELDQNLRIYLPVRVCITIFGNTFTGELTWALQIAANLGISREDGDQAECGTTEQRAARSVGDQAERDEQ